MSRACPSFPATLEFDHNMLQCPCEATARSLLSRPSWNTLRTRHPLTCLDDTFGLAATLQLVHHISGISALLTPG